MAEKYIARSSAIAARMLGGEMMVMSTEDSTFFTLNEVASAIWQAADGHTPLAEIVAGKICQEFDVDPEQAQRAADRFVDELSQHGILLVSDQPWMELDSSASPGAPMSLLAEMNQKALDLGLPVSVHFDITYRCNERCVHCYLDHDDHGELTTAEIFDVLTQLADAGVFFLSLSGGEVLLRRDFFEIVERARKLLFNVKVKTNGVMIHEKEAARLRQLGVEQIQISVYSHRPEVHDTITKLPGSLKRTIRAIRFLKSQGLNVTIANVLMAGNFSDQQGVITLARELGAVYTLDPTITPKMDGDTSILALRIPGSDLKQIFHNEELVGNVEEFCAPPPPPGEDIMDGFPCSAGHTACYISPYGDVFPCVQFPLPSGNVRRQKFLDIWHHSPELKEVRSIRARDLPTCSTCSHVGTCTRCPGLAYMEGNMRGPSTADCEKSFQRTGIPSANMLKRALAGSAGPLIQIQSLANPLHTGAMLGEDNLLTA